MKDSSEEIKRKLPYKAAKIQADGMFSENVLKEWNGNLVRGPKLIDLTDKAKIMELVRLKYEDHLKDPTKTPEHFAEWEKETVEMLKLAFSETKRFKEHRMYSNALNIWSKSVEKLLQELEQAETKTDKLKEERGKQPKYTPKEYALTYLFDLDSTGKQLPIRRIEGGCDAIQIKKDSTLFTSYTKKPDTFYRAVKSILIYDRNKIEDLQQISQDWIGAVRTLSNNWKTTEQYLKGKNLIGED